MNAHFLADTYLLKGANFGDIDEIRAVSDVRDLGPGEPIMTIDDESQDVMVLVSGRARVETKDGSSIDELRGGSMIGEIAFLDGKKRTANVFTFGECKVFVIPGTKLKEIMRKSPALETVIYRNAALALCQRLRDSNQQIESLMVAR